MSVNYGDLDLRHGQVLLRGVDHIRTDNSETLVNALAEIERLKDENANVQTRLTGMTFDRNCRQEELADLRRKLQAAPAERGVVLPDLRGAERCDVCSTITAKLDGDGCAKWCCHCGNRLTGDYVYATPATADDVREVK